MGLLNHFRNEPVTNLREEVSSSLRHLFATKQSYGAWQKGLGLEDYSGANFSASTIRQIENDIALNIQTYEKRIHLQEIEVSNFKSYADFEVKVTGEIEDEKVIFFIHITRRKETEVSIRFF